MQQIQKEGNMGRNGINRIIRGFLVILLLGLFACTENTKKDLSSSISTDPVKYQGIDISHYQGDIDWATVKKAGITFAFTKATEGDSEIDPKFKDNWAQIRKAGLARGAYHFFRPDVDAEIQANHFIATVRLEPGDLPPVLDIEVSEGATTEGIEDDISIWLEKVAQAYGVTPVIYSDLSFIKKHLASGFNTYPLWIADYSHPPPVAPGDWGAWTFWQYSQSGVVNGVNGAVDRDIYQGTVTGWQQLLIPPTR